MNTAILMTTTANETETSTRWLGECQICEKEHKLQHNALVHHGYARPGHGSIVGDCMGVHYPPFELSCERLKEYRADLAAHSRSQHIRLVHLRAGTIDSITRVKVRGTRSRRTEFETLKKETADPVAWEQAVRYQISEVESDIRHLGREIARVDARVARWEPKPLRSVEEAVRHEDGQRALRAAASAEARAAREAKAAATRAKQAALEARRAAIREGFANEFRAIAASSDSDEVKRAAAKEVAHRVMLKKNESALWVGYSMGIATLGCDDALTTLGLTAENGEWLTYLSPLAGGHRITRKA